jgi:hypothetical protein
MPCVRNILNAYGMLAKKAWHRRGTQRAHGWQAISCAAVLAILTSGHDRLSIGQQTSHRTLEQRYQAEGAFLATWIQQLVHPIVMS